MILVTGVLGVRAHGCQRLIMAVDIPLMLFAGRTGGAKVEERITTLLATGGEIPQPLARTRMQRLTLAVVVTWAGLVSPARGAVIVLTNFTPADLTVVVTEPERKPQRITLTPAQVAPVRVTGPVDVTFPTKPGPTSTFRLDVYNAYVFLPDPKTGIRLEGVELPGDPPFGDSRPEAKSAPPGPVKIPVTLMVDDADPRADELWHATIRKRLEAASAVIEAHAGVRFEVSGYSTWRSDPGIKELPLLLADMEEKVKPKRGELIVGYTSRRLEDKPKDSSGYGACRGLPSSHILLREWTPRADPERIEVLIHYLGLTLGATYTPDQGSVMREKIADGLALIPQYRYRFDPLNALAMNIWADELRRGPVVAATEVSPANRVRLTRVYKALLKTHPGDTFALTYLNDFDREIGRAPEPKKEPNKPAPNPARAQGNNVPGKGMKEEFPPRERVARSVVRAVTNRGRETVGPDALSGDELTVAYVRIAAETALGVEGLPKDSPERVSGFLLGLAIALDDTDALRVDALTEPVVSRVETPQDRDIRFSVLGNPTIRGRRDFCRRFVLGCGTGELLSRTRAEDVAITRSLALEVSQQPAGISLGSLAAECSGIAFARTIHDDLDWLRRLTRHATLTTYLVSTRGLRDGLSYERFEQEYGDAQDPRFQIVWQEIHTRVKSLLTP